MNLPYEVWLHIIEFLSDDSLKDLLGVNHMLFEIAMGERYREVRITRLDKRTLWMLARLRDPSIASRVRSLRVRPCFKDEFFNVWVMKHLGHTLANRARNVLHRTFRIPIPSWQSEKITLDMGGTSKVHLSLDDMIGDMIGTFTKLTCVSEFSIMAWVSGFALFYDMEPFYEASFAAFGSNLRKLSLVREMEGFYEVLHSSPHFPRLEELFIVFICESAPIINAPDDILRDLVAPFINRHRCTIRSWSISSRTTLDLSVLFVALNAFPILQRVALDITFNYSFWSDCSGLARLLGEHADSLQHVDFKVGRDFSPAPDLSSESYRGTWLTQNTTDETFFSRLKSLTFSVVHPRDCLLYTRGSADTLTKLVVGGLFLAFGEVESLAGIFSHRTPDSGLRNLSLNVGAFSPELVCLLARKLSDLLELSINCQACSARSSFEEDMHMHLFADWYLHDIGVWVTGHSNFSYRIEPDVLFVIAAYVPRIRSFWGQGYKGTGDSSCDPVFV